MSISVVYRGAEKCCSDSKACIKASAFFVAELRECYNSFQIVCNSSLNRLRNPLGSQFRYNLFKQDAFVRKMLKSELQELFC